MAALDDILPGYEDLSGHLAYGTGTAVTFWLLTTIF